MSTRPDRQVCQHRHRFWARWGVFGLVAAASRWVASGLGAREVEQPPIVQVHDEQIGVVPGMEFGEPLVVGPGRQGERTTTGMGRVVRSWYPRYMLRLLRLTMSHSRS